MDASAWLAIAGVLVGAATLGVTIPVLVLTRRQEKREAERSVVEWYASEVRDGLIRVTNQGLDPAHEVTVEAWDSHDVADETAEVLDRGDFIELVLTHRQWHGPDETDVPKSVMPRVPDSPPSATATLNPKWSSSVERMLSEQDDRWKLMKDLQDGRDASEAAMRRQAEAAQISLRVSWRTALGTWNSEAVPISLS
ncbi:hypothetical protein [Brachybacterium squillarum]|uniref:hypothetical protein n=1 Tax=Brachybacterium squillarum TaxID=661979 RepID=UPI002221C1AA|nr:hypothetical protein [Brachybacterium squillarum]MCW1805276.1 hypothetical protein [Brachybacterium squillarum]